MTNPLPINNSHLTAIGRKTLPLPVRWLQSQNLIQGQVLDYGCGKCASIDPAEWDSYDPFHPCTGFRHPMHTYDTVLCVYVLCTLFDRERLPLLLKIQNCLSESGTAYIVVRNDKPVNGWGISVKKTYQGRVKNLKLPCIRECSQYRIYRLTKNDKLV